MADVDSDLNPRKKIKTEHNPDKNGDNNEVKNDKPENVAAESSKVTKASVDKNDEENIVTDDIVEAAGREGSMDEEFKDDDNKTADVAMTSETNDSDSDVSALSDMSDLGEDSWKAMPAGPMSWVYKCMEDGVDPRSILKQIIPDESDIPDLDDYTLWKLVVNLVSEPPPRNKLPDINTLEDVIQLLQKCKNIMVLTGAGVSVSCGIPDFRSRNGIYARLAEDFPDLPDPQAMFDIRYFRRDQRPFFKFAKEIYPGQFEPSRCHKFIKLIEDHGKLLRNYTQNIDTLEQVAGIKNVIQCHGSFATATCMECQHKCSSDDIKEQILNQVIPWCPKCDPRQPLSVMKPDIVFFGESLPQEFHHQMSVDKDSCDLLIVIGSSLKVRPVALIPNSLPSHIPQILINKEHLRNLNFDVELLGDCDIVIGEICRRLGEDWSKIAGTECMTETSMDELLTPVASPKSEARNMEDSDTKPSSSTNIANDKQVVDNSGNVDSSHATSEKHPGDDKSDKPLPANDENETKSISSYSENIKSPSEKHTDLERKSESSDTHKSADDKKKVGDIDQIKSESLSDEGSGSTKDDVKPSCSSDLKEKTSLTADENRTRSNGMAYRHNVATKLGKNKFCFVPPHKYIFPEAEVFSYMKSDSSDSDSFSERDSSMDSSGELNQSDSSGSSEDVNLTTEETTDKKVDTVQE